MLMDVFGQINDPIATQPTRGRACNQSAPVGIAAARYAALSFLSEIFWRNHLMSVKTSTENAKSNACTPATTHATTMNGMLGRTWSGSAEVDAGARRKNAPLKLNAPKNRSAQDQPDRR